MNNFMLISYSMMVINLLAKIAPNSVIFKSLITKPVYANLVFITNFVLKNYEQCGIRRRVWH